MITVSVIGKGDRIVRPNTQFNTVKVSIGIIDRGLRHDGFETGLKPVNGKHNTLGQSDCTHINVKGDVMFFGTDASIQPYAATYQYYSDSVGGVAVAQVRGFKLTKNSNAFITHTIFNEGGSTVRVKIPSEYSRQVINFKVVYYYIERWLEYTCIRDRVFRIISYVKTTDGSTIISEVHQALWLKYSQSFEQVVQSTNNISGKFYGYVTDEKLVVWQTYAPSDVGNFTAVYDSTPEIPQESLINTQLYERWSLVQNGMVPPSHSDWGELSLAAAKNARILDINTSKYVADLLVLKDLLQPFMGLPTEYKNMSLKKLLSLASSGYLSVRYGVSLTLADTRRIVDAYSRLSNGMQIRVSKYSNELVCSIQENEEEVANPTFAMAARESKTTYIPTNVFGSRIEIRSTRNLTVYYKPHPIKEFRIMYGAFVADVFPKFETVNDYIPFSFIVNWFTPVWQQALDNVDYRTQTNLIILRGSCAASVLETDPIPAYLFLGAPRMGYITGTVVVRYYERKLQSSVPQPPSIDFDSKAGEWEIRRFIDGLSLIFQRLK